MDLYGIIHYFLKLVVKKQKTKQNLKNATALENIMIYKLLTLE